jgi:hypothetical protein
MRDERERERDRKKEKSPKDVMIRFIGASSRFFFFSIDRQICIILRVIEQQGERENDSVTTNPTRVYTMSSNDQSSMVYIYIYIYII